MPRRPRLCPPDWPVHVIQRGNNRQICFTSDDDIVRYVHWLAEGAHKFGVAIHGWVFMTNHIHLLMTPTTDGGVSLLMQFLGRLYVRSFNYKYSRTGTLFEGRFKSSTVQDSEYFLTCLRYIELNPVRAGFVTHPGDYRWSSFNVHARGIESSLWTPHDCYLELGDSESSRMVAYQKLMSENLDAATVAKIRHCANTGLILGTEKFRQQFTALTGDPN